MAQTVVKETTQNASTMVAPTDSLAQFLTEPMRRVNAIILDRMTSDVPMIPELAGYLIAAGGKRIRPLLTLACADMCGDETDNPKKLAAAVEFIHTATLLHDDVVDGSDQRRGKPAANAIFGNQASVLVGDFLFARAFELMVESDSLSALNILAKASSVITEGEILQMSLIGNMDTTQDQYFKIIEAKTAALFSASCEVAPVLTKRSDADIKVFRDYGHGLGMAFQIVDDIMDYTSTETQMGKSAGDDFMEGKMTLPVILGMQSASDDEKAFMQEALKNHNRDDLEKFTSLLNKYDAFDHSLTIAKHYADTACEAIGKIETASKVREDLLALPQYLLKRVS